MKIIKTEDIHRILQETFPKSKIPNAIDNLKMGDLEGWDSLGNFNVLLACEKRFKIKFNSREFSSLNSFKEIYKIVQKKA